jgi:two-component system sensor histidine kinase MtrB
MLGSFRSRLVATVIALVAVTALAVGGLGYLLVERSLRTQLVDDSLDRTRFNVTELATTDVLPAGADREDFAASGLLDRFVLRGTDGVFVDFGDGDPYASSLDMVETPARLSPELVSLVAEGEIGYQFVELDAGPALLVGARRPEVGPDFYFEYSAVAVEGALADLRRTLVGAGLGVALIGALVAGLIARTVLRPVRAASHGAHRMAGGDLEVRLAEEGGDEMAALAVAFNEMAASLQEKIAQLEDARARERRFVGDVSHELRTPLTALVNEVALVEPHLGSLPPPARRAAEMLGGDVARLRRLVDDLLEVSRLDSDHFPPALSTIDVAAFLGAVVAERLPEAVLSAPGGPQVTVDRRGLERVVANLLDNARAHAPRATVTVTASVDDAVLVVEVADTGPGVPDEALPHLFDRFFMVDPSRRGGTGLGLSIAARHAARMGGDLTARHGPGGRGMVFRLRVPVTASLPGGDSGATSAAESEGVHPFTGGT